MKTDFKKKLFSWLPVFLWGGVIFYLSSLTSTPSGNWFFEKVAPYLAHLAEYAVLYFLLLRATGKTGLSFFLGILYAFSDEFHQSFVPGRVPDAADVGLDLIGMVLAWLVIRLARPARLKTR